MRTFAIIVAIVGTIVYHTLVYPKGPRKSPARRIGDGRGQRNETVNQARSRTTRRVSDAVPLERICVVPATVMPLADGAR